jgi:hypothetical protein
MRLGKLTPEDLQLYLTFVPLFEQMVKEGHAKVRQERDHWFNKDTLNPAWFHLYELPIEKHVTVINEYMGFDVEVKVMAATENPPKTALETIQRELQEGESSETFQITDVDPNKRAMILGFGYSMYSTFQSLLAYGLYLNELVALVAKGGKDADGALFNAVKIDPTAISCNPLSVRISQAVLEDDQKFLNKLSRSFLGKKTKREHKVYQQQRVILQVLLETGAEKLTSDDLYELFAEQLKITARDTSSDKGDVSENLRQFAYQFMKQKSVS